MRKFTKLVASAATAVAAAALVAGSVTTAAFADPPKGVTPQPYDIVGVGSNTTQFVMDGLSDAYNKTVGSKHSKAHPFFYSYDATPPGVTAPGTYFIIPKVGCQTKTGKGIVRPNGSTAGLKALDQNQTTGKSYCLDFGRSSSSRSASAPPPGPHGVLYVAFARDALTYATRGSKFGGTNAPSSLTIKQLFSIFDCKVKTWGQVGVTGGAASQPIHVYLPQPGSGSLATWEKMLGITALGSCVSQAPEENEGTDPHFKDPNAIFIFSIGSYIAQKYHSAACGVKPTSKQNKYGCNSTGVLTLDKIGGVAPTTSAAVPVINPAFPAHFWRTLYNIVRWTAGTRDHLPANLEPFFSSHALHGFMCGTPTAKTIIADYGFVNYGKCGATS